MSMMSSNGGRTKACTACNIRIMDVARPVLRPLVILFGSLKQAYVHKDNDKAGLCAYGQELSRLVCIRTRIKQACVHKDKNKAGLCA